MTQIVVIGGGAAGFFGAIQAAACHPQAQVTILERGQEVLSKVKISGGGRCNLTHACYNPRDLVKYYPRGERELLGPFHAFAPGDTIAWFAAHGVSTHTESDGRVFPTTNLSASVIEALRDAAQKAGVRVLTQQRVENILPPNSPDAPWMVVCAQTSYPADHLLVASGSSTAVWDILRGIGLHIVDPVPSLFTFQCPDPRIQQLPGISVPMASLQVEGSKLSTSGPLLITHWGWSGPAVLRLSAWGAREFHARNYRFPLLVNWISEPSNETLAELELQKSQESKKLVENTPLFNLPARLWKSLVTASLITGDKKWGDLSKKQLQALCAQLTQGRYEVIGKSTFKEEFVTAGGVDLKEINFKSFECKRFPRLYIAGEALNIDAVTGGFNFQAAWTGGWIAGSAMGNGNT